MSKSNNQYLEDISKSEQAIAKSQQQSQQQSIQYQQRIAQSQERMNSQLNGVLVMSAVQTGVQVAQLGTLQDQLQVQETQLRVGIKQLNVQTEIRNLARSNLAVSHEQLAQAIATVKRLDANHRMLGKLDASLDEIHDLLTQQNSLVHKSLNRLATEVQELVIRGEMALNNGWFTDAAKDFEVAINKNPYATAAHYNLARCYAALGKADEAAQAYNKCIYYGKKNAPIYECKSLCDLATAALAGSSLPDARLFLRRAALCMEKDTAALAITMLRCDIAEDRLSPDTGIAILDAIKDKNIKPDLLLEDLTATINSLTEGKLKTTVMTEMSNWRQATATEDFERTISDFYRELDDYVYLAPRVRRGFMEAADGSFLSLAGPLSDLLDLTGAVGERLIKRISVFSPDHNEIIKHLLRQRAWKSMLVLLSKLTSELAAKSAFISGKIVGKLNIGLLRLPISYEDDKVIFELPTAEGDTLCLTCHYAIFIRNGIDQFAFPLHELSKVRFEMFPAPDGFKGIAVVVPTFGQILLQGTTGSFQSDALHHDPIYFVDLFVEAADILRRIHEQLFWAEQNQPELYSTFVILNWLADQLVNVQPARGTTDADEDFEIVSEGEDDNFEVVN